MSTSQNEELLQSLLEWLAENSLQFGDILSDERGYFVFDLNEVGHPSEGAVEYKRHYLPAKYQDLCL